MSGLEKFEGTEAWFARLKSFMFVNRELQTSEPSVDQEIVDYSADFTEVLQSHKLSGMNSGKENKAVDLPSNRKLEGSLINFRKTDSIFSNITNSTNHNDSTFCDETSLLRQTTDESFERVEKMCNKSLSDQNSTLYHYVHDIKAEGIIDAETEALERMLSKLGTENEAQELNQTQLASVEPPSCMWDDTVSEDSLLYQKSPVKLVGLLRPSTIMEESSSSECTNSTSFTYRSAQRSDETTTEDYQSANDGGATSKISSTDVEYSGSCSSYATLSVAHKDSVPNDRNELFRLKKHAFFDDDLSKEILTSESFNDESEISSHSVSHGKTKNTLSDVSSIPEDSLNVFTRTKESYSTKENTNSIFLDSLEIQKSNLQNSSVGSSDLSIDPVGKAAADMELIEISDDSTESIQEPSVNEDDSNRGATVSREFNDTLEEIDFIMKCGMQYMANKNSQPKVVQDVILKPTAIIAKTAPMKVASPSPMKVASPSPMKVSSPSPFKGAVAKQFKNPSIEKPKVFDTFKKPMASSRIPLAKGVSSAGKNRTNFANVISPVAAYIKNTAQAPLLTNIKTSTSTIRSKALRQLEYESRFQNDQMNKSICGGAASSLPRKAYIAADFQQVIDERTQLKIPGSQKIQKFLQPLPSVIKHDGRIKMNIGGKAKNAAVDRSIDNSLADLSVVSGDVSIHTYKDAKKWAK